MADKPGPPGPPTPPEGTPERSGGPDLTRLRKEGGAWAAEAAAAAKLAGASGGVARTSRRPPGRLATLAATLVLLWAGAVAWYLWRGASDELARTALGTWTTTEPRYADRSFGLTDSTVTLGVGNGVRVTYPIRKVRRGPAAEEVRYDITYVDDDGPVEMTVYFDPLALTIRMENPAEVIWRRAEPAGSRP